MIYKGYTGITEVDEDSGELFGTVIGIRDVITFVGRTVDEARKSFEESIDYYLKSCQESGRQPDQAFSGQFMVRIDPETHQILATRAAILNMTFNEVIAKILVEASMSPKISVRVTADLSATNKSRLLARIEVLEASPDHREHQAGRDRDMAHLRGRAGTGVNIDRIADKASAEDPAEIADQGEAFRSGKGIDDIVKGGLEIDPIDGRRPATVGSQDRGRVEHPDQLDPEVLGSLVGISAEVGMICPRAFDRSAGSRSRVDFDFGLSDCSSDMIRVLLGKFAVHGSKDLVGGLPHVVFSDRFPAINEDQLLRLRLDLVLELAQQIHDEVE
jgi:predicted HicB family RNase H-like nuclease